MLKHQHLVNIVPVPLTIIGLAVSFASAGVGHGSYLPFIAFFPFAAIFLILGIPILAFLVACLQFYIYAAAMRVAAKGGWLRFLVYGLLATHLLAVMVFMFS
jgi:hypothetical protein